MPFHKTISEYGLIRNADDFAGGTDSFSEIYLSGQYFQQLKLLAGQTEAESLLTLFWQKGRETLRVRNYVGLLETADGTQIEILPKISPPKSYKEDTARLSRKALLMMLRSLRNSPFRSLSAAHTRTSNLPIWEVFISAFLDETERVIGQGLQQSYVANEANERFWKGKFQLSRHLRQNLHYAERLAVVYDKRTLDTAPNRILKTTLLYLRPKTATLPNQARLQQVLQAFDEVGLSTNLTADWQTAQPTNRLSTRYEGALRWAKALLGNQVYGIQAGESPTHSLLFPMERIFENYVTRGIQMYWPTGEVSAQESSAHLVEEHSGSPKFRLRPDLIIRDRNRTLVLDTKWKHINGHDQTGNYGIESADLYQLYAYGKKYSADDLFLIYPASNTFQKPLDVFGYDLNTRLHVLPFDVTQPLQQEVEKLAQQVYKD